MIKQFFPIFENVHISADQVYFSGTQFQKIGNFGIGVQQQFGTTLHPTVQQTQDIEKDEQTVITSISEKIIREQYRAIFEHLLISPLHPIFS